VGFITAKYLIKITGMNPRASHGPNKHVIETRRNFMFYFLPEFANLYF